MEYAGDAKTAVAQLDDTDEAWIVGVRSLDDGGLERAVGEAEREWASATYADPVLHINREAIHHLAETHCSATSTAGADGDAMTLAASPFGGPFWLLSRPSWSLLAATSDQEVRG